MNYLRSGASVIVIRPVADGLTKHNLRVVAGWPVVGQVGDVVVRQPV